MGQKLLYTGATGFVGGSVLSRLLNSSYSEIRNLDITVLVRKQEQANLLKQKGVEAIVFEGLDDSNFLRKTASEYDYVIHTPTGFHASSAVALIEGLAQRKIQTGKDVHFIHTSGTSNLAERASNKEIGEVHEWSDLENVFEFEEKKEKEEAYGQRTTDIAVVKLGEKTGVRTYIMMPPTVYGRGSGLFNQGSMQIPSIIRGAIKAGVPQYVGDGKARLGHVHVTDLALLYELVLNKVFHNWLDIAEHVGKAGVALGALQSAEPRSVTLEEAASKWLKATPQVAEMNYASNSATKPVLATKLGWKPRKTENDWEESFVEAFQMVLDEQK
ncbi:NAD dependent epimerase/dehydratase [Colletotrichum graminicola]|uniref:NAD dependent epimerase/dehydratase n=1 Tax=Colletotrichum graminicola (strain M1.001 / M2 / FGSC 10212) TaxID=645133 RepID=E3QFL4_COLGM|nr:NAD dependent epimerase/dehydratase [Colletotrichum graminicola M1.001]EFQ29652.1 NAD dependent epimerase/dehydratase [Colletotrichum graminicola M1.001]WDK23652.1 NAD dependent epimerase/dehydratase [Colletotrichum graminicola]